jgi:hypothetical protein
MTQLFLTSAQLVELTGAKQAKRQMQWLADSGYQFDVGLDGRPKLLLEAVRERQCRKAECTPGPDWSWLKSAV